MGTGRLRGKRHVPIACGNIRISSSGIGRGPAGWGPGFAPGPVKGMFVTPPYPSPKERQEQ